MRIAHLRHGDTIDRSSNGELEAYTAWLVGPTSVQDAPREEFQGHIIMILDPMVLDPPSHATNIRNDAAADLEPCSIFVPVVGVAVVVTHPNV
jgi:hypothetical protein